MRMRLVASCQYRVSSIEYLVSSILVALVLLVLPLAPAFAQASISGGVAVNVEVKDTDVVEGSIISATKDGFKKSTQAYDIAIYGVVTAAPILSVKPKTDTTRAVVSSGDAQVLVSTANGEIKEGDLITSGTTAGVGQKATQGGYVVGKALGAYSDSSKPGLVPILVNVSFSGGGGAVASGVGSLIGLATNPQNSRIAFAVLVGLIALIVALIGLTRLVTSGVTAVGRNPLARGTIYRSMIISGVVVAAIAIAGAGAVIAIIALGS